MFDYDEWMNQYIELLHEYEEEYQWYDVSSTLHIEQDDGMDGWADTYSWIIHLPETEER